jgi:hypothetical protein
LGKGEAGLAPTVCGGLLWTAWRLVGLGGFAARARGELGWLAPEVDLGGVG